MAEPSPFERDRTHKGASHALFELKKRIRKELRYNGRNSKKNEFLGQDTQSKMSRKAKIACPKPSKSTGGPLLSLEINSLRNGRLLTRTMDTTYLHRLLPRCQHTICRFRESCSKKRLPKNHKTPWLFWASKLYSKPQIVSIATVMCCESKDWAN